MPNINKLMTRYSLEIDDLPDPQGVNIVKVHRFDSEEYSATENGRPINKIRHLVYFEGFKLPLRMNNTRLKVLASILGSEQTEDWYSRKIGLQVGVVSSYGEVKQTVVIYPMAVDQNAPAVFQRGVHRVQAAPTHNALPQITPPGSIAQSAGALPAGPGGQNVSPTAAGPIGKDSAAKMLWALKSRGKTWQDLLDHLKRSGADQGCQGVMPYEVPGHVIPWYQQYCRGFPAMTQIDQAPFITKTIADWTPPPVPPAPASTRGEVINTATGEVITLPSPPPDDSDIPF